MKKMREFGMKNISSKIKNGCLFRKVNTRTRNVNHHFGSDYRHDRNTKKELMSICKRGSMHSHKQRGRDYCSRL